MNRALAPFVDVMFGHEGDLAAMLCDSSYGAPWHNCESYKEMAARVCEEFEDIKVIATATRRARSADRNDWTAFGFANGEVYEGIKFDDLEVFDRVGGGDSFAAGLIFGLMEEKGMQWALNCGVAHGALAMTTPGDSSMAVVDEVERLMAGGSAAVQR